MSARRIIPSLVAMLVVFLTMAPAAHAEFGLNAFKVAFENEDGTPATEAGSHPYAMTTSFRFNTRVDSNPELGVIPDEEAKSLRFDLPAGLAGNPTAVPRCPSAAFGRADADNRNACADDTAIGVALVTVESAQGSAPERSPVYNLVPAPGVTAKIGFIIHRTPITIDLGVNGESPNEIQAGLMNVPQALYLYGASLEVWGNPANPSHDEFRGKCLSTVSGPNGELVSLGICPDDNPEAPFLTLPRSCQGPLVSTYEAISWQHPDAAPVIGSTQTPGMEGCASLGFAPTIAAGGTSSGGESSSGLDFDLDVPDPGLTAPTARADSDIERAVVTLPEGFTTNPSVAGGLQACRLSDYRSEDVNSDPGTGCPEASKIGSVEIETPLLERGEGGEGLEVLDGSLYVAAQHDNPFDNLLTIYMIIKDPALGILVKQAGRVEPDPSTGRLTTTFGELPQLPFSHFHLHFFEGNRAPLLTPPVCGTYQAAADLYPYATGVPPVHRSAGLIVSSACATSSAAIPSTFEFSAGTTSSTAGTYSPFLLNLSRPDGSQQLSRIKTTLPGGLLGKLAGIPYCPEPGLAQAASRGGEGEGARELASPSCPSSSQVGTVTATAGAGTEPLTVTGKAYLAGPYKGAPLSLEIVTPAIAGPFDLGVVAVRTALQVDPLTTQITAESDPIPTILHGLPLDLRSISIDMDRPSFTLNPTSCEPKAITGQAISTLGSVAPLSQYFQASNCAALAFKPKLKLSLSGSTKHAGHPGLKAVLTYPKGSGYSNIARAQVNLPHSEFIDQANLNKTCTKPVLLAGSCPKSTIYGKAKAWSPLLDQPLVGNVYLVGGFGFKLPALVAELGGQIRALLVGKVDSGPNNGIRNTFEAVPDAPVEKFELRLKGGKKYSLLENSENLCKKPQRAIARFTSQSGKVLQTKPLVGNQCGKKKGNGKKKGSGNSRSDKAESKG
jgi:hypothetical protein